MWAGHEGIMGYPIRAVATAFPWEWSRAPLPPAGDREVLHNQRVFASLTIGGTRVVENDLSVHNPLSCSMCVHSMIQDTGVATALQIMGQYLNITTMLGALRIQYMKT